MAKTDKKTLELIKLVKQQKEEIAKAERPVWKTNRMFTYIEGSSNVVNLAVESNVKSLVLIASFLMDKELSYKRAATALGVDNPPEFTWGGYPLSDWLDDLKLRITKIQIETKRKKLEALEERLNKIISPELRTEMELEAVARELSS